MAERKPAQWVVKFARSPQAGGPKTVRCQPGDIEFAPSGLWVRRNDKWTWYPPHRIDEVTEGR